MSEAPRRSPLALVAIALAVVACNGGSRKVADDAGAPADAGPSDPAELASRFDRKCVAGDLEACRNLGVMYAEGIGVSHDQRRAAALFGQACNGGNMSACNNLAFALAEGMGIERNIQRAIEVYQKACDGGYKLACRNLGLLLRDGRGTPADLNRADTLLDKACKGAVPLACTNAGDLDAMLATKGAPARWKQAVGHYKQGCDAGDPTACRQIGLLYLEGIGLPKSTSAAAMWLERACVPADPIGCRVLGGMVLQGVGVPKDVERGKRLLARACDAKDQDACNLAKLANEPAGNDAGVSAVDAALASPTPGSAAEGSGSATH